MRVVSIAAVALAGLLVCHTHAVGQVTDGPAASGANSTRVAPLLRTAINDLQTRADADRQQWRIRLTQAKADVSRSKRLALVGAGGLVLTLLMDNRDGYVWMYVLRGTSAGLAGYGAYTFVQSKSRLTAIENEGRAKGFSVSLRPDAAAVSFRWAFN